MGLGGGSVIPNLSFRGWSGVTEFRARSSQGLVCSLSRVRYDGSTIYAAKAKSQYLLAELKQIGGLK